MKMTKWIGLAAWVGLAAGVRAEGERLRVAVLRFEDPAREESSLWKQFLNQALDKAKSDRPVSLGDKIADLLTAHLGDNPAVELVERTRIDAALDELALGKTGLVKESDAARLGHWVGAKVLVTGKAFPLDDELFIVAKVIGVETGRVFAAKANGPLSGKLSPLVESLAKDVSKILLKEDGALVAPPAQEEDPVQRLERALGKALRPRVAVQVREEHWKEKAQDPAVETEIIYLLRKTGFAVSDKRSLPLSDWARAYLEGETSSRPPSADAEVVIVGEAFSEFAARRGDLVSCKARVELRALDARTGEVLAIERRAGTGVDIAEMTAAKNALQRAAQEAAVDLFPAFMKRTRGAKP